MPYAYCWVPMRKYLFFMLLSLFLCLNAVEAQETGSSLLSRGLQLINEEKYESALAEFAKIIKNDPNNKEAHYYRGLTFLKAEKYSEAVAPFERVLKLDPMYSGARRNLGIVYLNLESNDLAIQELTKSLDQDPQDASAHFYLGRALQQKEQYEESLIHFQIVLSLDPDLEQIALFQIGLAYSKLEQKEDAKLALTMALEKAPESATASVAEDLLNELGGKTSKSKNNGWFTAKVGWQADDNLSVTQQDLVTNQADSGGTFELSTGYKFYSTPALELQLGYDFYQSAWSDVSELNYISNTFSLRGSHNEENWDAGIDYYYNYSFLNAKDFLTSHTIAPRMGFSLQPQLYTNLSLTVSDTSFLGDNLRNATNTSVGFDQYLFFMENKAYGFLSYRHSDESAKGSEFDYTGNYIGAGVNFPGSDKMKIQFSYSYNLLEYKNNTASIGRKRRDEKHGYRILLTHPILESLNLEFDYQYNLNNSNLVSVDSKQNLLALKLAFSY